MEAAAITKKKKRIPEPHAYVMLFLVICLAMVLTWVIPAGNFDKAEAGSIGLAWSGIGQYNNLVVPYALVRYVALFRKGDASLPARKAILVQQRALLAKRLENLRDVLGRLDAKIANYEERCAVWERKHLRK